MRPTTRLAATATILLALVPLSAESWDEPPAGVISIAQARERADIGDYLVIEGKVVDSDTDGVFELEDPTGRMLVVIPEHLTRKEGTPRKTELIRVAGKYDTARLDQSVEGVRVMTLWRGSDVTGGRGDPAPAEDAQAVPVPSPESLPPAAAAGDRAEETFRPTASPQMVEKLARARREWLAAVAELEEASGEYARALYAAGDDGTVDPAIAARNDVAEARVERASARIPELVEEARRAGVSEETLRLYVEMTTRQR
jgi:uncharacterized protein YdeI (BOF family)